MASVESQKPDCPVCHQADQVKTLQAAYASGVERAAPPDMPTKHVSMMTFISIGIVLIGVCVILILILIGGLENNFPFVAQLALAVVTILCILTTLGLSYYAFQRVVRGDTEASEQYPAWDEAMETWRSLSYCSRDDVVFDPKANKTLSNDQLAVIRASGQPKGEVQSALARQH